MKRALEVMVRDKEGKIRRGVTVQLQGGGGEVQYAVTDLDGLARFRVRDVATLTTITIVIDQVASRHLVRDSDRWVERIEIVR